MARQNHVAALAGRWLDPALLGRLPIPALAVLAGLCFVFIAVRFAEPILDGDLFWHFAYARQMIERGSLIPDHTLYSWTPTSNALIYCSWASELVLYGLWQLTGLTGIFALRYAVVVLMLYLVWRFARQRGISCAPVTVLCLVSLIELTYAGTLQKPELFSLIFFTTVVFAYATSRAAATTGQTSPFGFYAVPVVLAVWVNCHGGFILVAPFLAATAVGEVLLYFLAAQARLPPRLLLHLLVAWGLCGVAILLTPYGIAYPAMLIHRLVLGTTPLTDLNWNAAYVSIFSPLAGQRFVVGLIAMPSVLAILGTLAWRRSNAALLAWLPLALAAIVYIPLYVTFLRSTQFLPIVVAFLALGLAELAANPKRVLERDTDDHSLMATQLGGGAVGILALIGIAQAFLNEPGGGLRGFGIGYVNPVQEAEFLARQNLGPDIYNVFDSGGYLLWRLYPRYRVMIDSRSFPYLSWFEELYDFTTGRSFEAFLKKYPADVAVIDLAKAEQWQNFLKTRDWRMVYFGQTAAVFVKENKQSLVVRSELDADPARFSDLQSADAGVNIFRFATFVGDYGVADAVLRRLETTLRWHISDQQLARAEAYRDAVRAIHRHDYAEALDKFQLGIFDRPVSDRDRVVLTLLVSLVRTPLDAASQTQIVDALTKIVPPGF
jgi:hypothetical protein